MTYQTPPPGAQPSAPQLSDAEDRQWASFAHLGGILSFLPALIIWLVFRQRGAFTNVEAKEALNFQITLVIAQVAGQILGAILLTVSFGLLFFVPTLIWLALSAIAIIFSVIGFSKAKDGNAYRYPFALRLIR
jgi:uncharacterized Tic20 family protein